METVVIIVALLAAASARLAYIAVSVRNSVDHYYWILAARAYRAGGPLPVKIADKYLLEDEHQSYPPLFGWLLGRLPERWVGGQWAVAIVQAAEVATAALLLAWASSQGHSLLGLAIIIAVYGTAPVLVAYNTQLASRAYGNLFFTASILALAAASDANSVAAYVLWLTLAIAAGGAVILSHKMTTQLMAVLWPLWPLAMGDPWMLLVVPAAIGLAIVVTGWRFALLQWRAHADIVSFWHQNWEWLGAHPFAHSPIYGEPERRDETTFHKRGWRGMRAHAELAFGYLPLLWLAPLTLAWDPLPQGWVLVWALGTGGWALATLYVPLLRCLGGGHLYLFNAAAPTALWWAEALERASIGTVVLFLIGLVLTLVALARGYYRRARAPRADPGFEAAVERLAASPPGRVAVFPLTAIEEVAFRTPHAVLWGAHGYGFRRLEILFPVFRKRISEILREHRCDWLLYDSNWWPRGDAVVHAELPGARVETFGSWALVRLPSNG